MLERVPHFQTRNPTTVLMAKSPRKHTLCTPLSIDQLYIFGIFEHKWGTQKHIDDLKKYSWCIPVQKKIKPIIWGAAIMPEPWNRQQCQFFKDPKLRVVRLLESLTTINHNNCPINNVNRTISPLYILINCQCKRIWVPFHERFFGRNSNLLFLVNAKDPELITTKFHTYLALTGELLGIFCECVVEKTTTRYSLYSVFNCKLTVF